MVITIITTTIIQHGTRIFLLLVSSAEGVGAGVGTGAGAGFGFVDDIFLDLGAGLEFIRASSSNTRIA